MRGFKQRQTTTSSAEWRAYACVKATREDLVSSSQANAMGEKQDNSSIEKLCEIFSKIIEQPKVTSEIFIYALEPNPVKLSGPENYVSWARQAKLILGSHGYEKLLIATDREEDKGKIKGVAQILNRLMIECSCGYWVVWNQQSVSKLKLWKQVCFGNTIFRKN